jgi:hypothetical protein
MFPPVGSQLAVKSNTKAMDKTRGNTSGPLNRWDAHRAELTDKALGMLSSPKVKQAFRDWVVKGENAPQYGDTLYDQLMCIANGMSMNRMFMFKTWEYGDSSIEYYDCILRVKFGNCPPGTRFETISVDPTTLEISTCDMTLPLHC